VFDVLRNTYANEIIVYDKTYDAPVPAVKPEKIVPVREAKPKAPPVPRAPRMPTPAKPTAEKLREPWERATEIQVTVTNAEALREHLMSTRALSEKEAGRVMLFLDTMKNGNPGPELRAEFARQLHMKQKSYDRAVERATFFADVALGALPISVRGLAAERPDLVQITYPEPVTG
jgi:hypothetical protein